MLKAFVTAELTKEAISELSKHLSLTFGGWAYDSVKLAPAQLVEKAKGCEVLVICYEDINEYVLTNLPDLKYIACTRGGIENIDVAAVKRHGVLLSNTPGRNASAVADLAVGLMIATARSIPQTYRYIMDRRWDEAQWDIAGNTPHKRFAGAELEGKTLGLIGFGAIGRKVAERARGFGMDLLAYDPFVKPVPSGSPVRLVDLDTLLAGSDFISLHCKVTKQSEGIINKQTLAKMKKSAYLINTARGRLVNEQDLYEALKTGVIKGAALDTLIEEPISHDHPFLGLKNIVITPHIGGASQDIVKHQSRMVVEDVAAYLNGRSPVHVVA